MVLKIWQDDSTKRNALKKPENVLKIFKRSKPLLKRLQRMGLPIRKLNENIKNEKTNLKKVD